jgi:hypothetical protein
VAAGAVRVSAGDGEAREIGRADAWRMEDRRGKGHHPCVIGKADFEAAVAQFD